MSDPVQEIARQLHIATLGDGLMAKIRLTIDLLQEAASERDQLRATIAQQAARIDELEAPMLAWTELDYTKQTRRSLMCYIGQQNFRITAQENQLAALKEQQRGGVVLSERQSPEDEWHGVMKDRAIGWNACLDEVARLNQPGECVAVPSLSAIEAAFDEACGGSGSAVPIGEPLYSISLSEAAQAIRTLLAQQGKETDQ